MSDEEFEKYVKIFFITGKWEVDEYEHNMFELYKNIDSNVRFRLFFELKNSGVPVNLIFYSTLTFVSKIMSVGKSNDTALNVHYFQLLQSKQPRVVRNFKKAITNYSKYDRKISDDLKVFRFIYDIGV
jgi:hypothetical protein